MDQADDFFRECQAVEALVEPLSEPDYGRKTRFKGWTINQILRHLHVWNHAAQLSLTDEAGFRAWMDDATQSIGGGNMPDFEKNWLDGASGRTLFDIWRETYPAVAESFAEADPSHRVPWVGPSMSARSSITARLMETWAHSQAIYDELGIERANGDHIRNIVVLGFNTYGWTFANRRMEVPEPRPQLVLTAPSGEIWTYGEDAGDERIEGAAEQFCQVVTQTRNIADTELAVSGSNAREWMSVAQCFAGPPNDPPKPGERRIRD